MLQPVYLRPVLFLHRDKLKHMDIGWCLKLNSPALLGNSGLLQKKEKNLMNHLVLSSLDALMGFKTSAWLSRALLPETRQSRPSNWYSLFSARAGTFWSDVFSRLPYEILFEESILILKEKVFKTYPVQNGQNITAFCPVFHPASCIKWTLHSEWKEVCSLKTWLVNRILLARDLT